MSADTDTDYRPIIGASLFKHH